ncbi:hypothetical protein [Vulgatibacter sp.]|uniref:hypothetical protein n=1 Tax=Vulgatibacter sp. TaxID=1971226 RepID=UPI00356342D4
MANERRDGQAGTQGGGPGGRGGFGGGAGGRGPGGPGGFGGRGGPGGPGRGGFGRDDRGGRGGRRGEDRGPVGFEGAALEFARTIDKPLLAADYEAQLAPLEKLATQARKGGGKNRSIDELPHDSRGKLLTALLRVMRQTKPVEGDEEKEGKRKQVFATLASVWAGLNDERRAEMAKEEAGDAQIAPHLLAWTGEWDKVAALAEHERRFGDAAKLYEEHDRLDDAARLYRKAGDVMRAIGIYTKQGNRDAVVEAAKDLKPEQQEQVLLDAGLGDVYMDLLVQADRWEDVGRLYERAEQWADAARAYEKVGRTHKAIRAWDQAGETAEAERLIEAEVQERLDASDRNGAAKLWARFGRSAKAAELATNPLDRFRWMREAGQVEEAKALAREELGKVQEASKGPLDQAPWLARSGDTANALRIYDEHRKPEDAAALFEELEDWELAARCHEVAGKTRRAADLFERAGNTEAAERLRAMEPEKPKAPARKPGGGGGRGPGGGGRGGRGPGGGGRGRGAGGGGRRPPRGEG